MGTHPIFESDFDCLTDRQMPNRYTVHHGIAFTVTFITYAFFHAARKTLSNSKDSISIFWTDNQFNQTWPAPHNDELVWTRTSLARNYEQAAIYLGTLDTTFMMCYAIGLFISGYIGEKYSLRHVLALGTILNATTLFIFGCVLPATNCTHIGWWILLWGLNGLAQSTGWPSVVTIMGNWFPAEGRGLVMGVWSSCQSLGNILGAFMVNSFLGYGFEYSFFFISYCLAFISLLVFFAIVNHPDELGLGDDVSDDLTSIIDDEEVEHPIEANEDSNLNPAVEQASGNKGTVYQIITLPGVPSYALSFFALKLVNYSFFFWLPYFLHNQYRWSDSTANVLSTWFDVGGIVGGTVGGIGSDYWGRRSPVVFGMAVLAVPSLFLLNGAPGDQMIVSALMSLCGLFIGGASNMIGAACAADLGKRAVEYGMPSAVSMVTGFIDGTDKLVFCKLY